VTEIRKSNKRLMTQGQRNNKQMGMNLMKHSAMTDRYGTARGSIPVPVMDEGEFDPPTRE
jgi:hypothetical protein